MQQLMVLFFGMCGTIAPQAILATGLHLVVEVLVVIFKNFHGLSQAMYRAISPQLLSTLGF